MPEQENLDTIKRAATRGIAWTGIESVLRQVLQIGTQIALARLLLPSDFGLLGMALAFQGVAQLIADFGIGSAIVQHSKLDRLALASSFWANLGVATLLTCLMYFSAPLIGQFYANSSVVPVIEVLALTIFIGGLSTLPRALLYKGMEFGVLARIGVVSSLAGALVAISMAALGFGVWSLVAQPVVGNVTALTMLWLATTWRPHFAFSWPSMKSLATFSYGVLGTRLLSYATRNADNLIIGRYLGSGPLGYYALAYQIMLYPLSQVSSVIVKVLFPTLSKLQSDQAEVQSAFLHAVGAIAFITFPMMMGLLAVADDFIAVVFGEKWLPMALVLKMFCGVGLLQSIGTTVGTIYLSTGKTSLMLRVTLFATPIIVASFVIGLPWGIDGVAVSYFVVSVFLFYVLMQIALRLIDLTLLDVLGATIGVIAATTLMFVAVSTCLMLMDDTGSIERLVVGVLTGVITYSVASLFVNRKQLFLLIKLGRRLLLRSKA